MVRNLNNTSCFENWIALKRMWGLTLIDYNSTLTKNVLMTILKKNWASKLFLFMRYEKISDHLEQKMVIKMNDTSFFENWIALKWIWGLTLTNYNSTPTKNALMTILGKTIVSKSFWFMKYEISSKIMRQDMVNNMNNTSCFNNWIALERIWGLTFAGYNKSLTENALMTILGQNNIF